MKSILIMSIALFIGVNVLAQNKNEVKGDWLLSQNSFLAATESYQNALTINPDNPEIISKLVECYRKVSDDENTVKWYERIINNSEIIESIDKFYYAQALNSIGYYSEAKKWFDAYSEEVPEDKVSKIYSANIEGLKSLYKDSSLYQVEKVNFNSLTSDFSPAYHNDGLVFVSDRRKQKGESKWRGDAFLDLYFCAKDLNGNFQQSGVFNKKMNTRYHEGPLSFYNQGKKLVLTRSNFDDGILKESSEGIVKLKMYFATIDVEGNWSRVEAFRYNNDEYTVGHPTITEDGQTLYFVSDMPGGYGGTDIYKSNYINGDWSTPENLGEGINTKENEVFPFLHNNEVLYFTSNGYGGFGGLDIFKYEFANKKVVNVGYPINSAKDDFGLIISPEGDQGFFASNRKAQLSDDDIYSFKVSPISEVTVKYKVIDAVLGTPIPNSRIVVKSKDEVAEEVTFTTDENGIVKVPLKLAQQYRVGASKADYIDNAVDVSPVADGEEIIIALAKDCLPVKGIVEIPESQQNVDSILVVLTDKGTLQKDTLMISANEYYEFCVKAKKEYNLSISKKKFFAQSFDFDTHDEKPAEIKPVKLEEIIIGKAIELENIYYDMGKSDIRADAALELDKLVSMLEENNTIEIELSSHTDSRGSDVYNLDLSQKRAKSAVEYIISQGIDSNRITDKGYGETDLMNHCANGVKCSTEEHQANRRTEFKVLQY